MWTFAISGLTLKRAMLTSLVSLAAILLAGIIYMLCKPYKEATKLSVK